MGGERAIHWKEERSMMTPSHALLALAVIFSALLPHSLSSLTEDEFFKQVPAMHDVGPFNDSITALYVFGDSLVDSGNNKYLKTPAKADYPPYGVDFGNKPTGRFTNGRTMADLIAQLTALPFPPPILGSENKTILTGMNYASGSCGVLPITSPLGLNSHSCLSFDEQIDLFEDRTVKSLKLTFKDEEKVSHHIEKSLVYISMGSNDFARTYFKNTTLQSEMDPACFAKHVIAHLSKLLERLYNLGVRKFLMSNVGALGCIPMIRDTNNVTVGCVKPINDVVVAYNSRLRSLFSTLQSELSGSTFVLVDSYKVGAEMQSEPEKYGLKNITAACIRKDPAGLCNNRDEYFFFDDVHPSQKIHFQTLTRCFHDTNYCSPLTLKQLLCPCDRYSYLHNRA